MISPFAALPPGSPVCGGSARRASRPATRSEPERVHRAHEIRVPDLRQLGLGQDRVDRAVWAPGVIVRLVSQMPVQVILRHQRIEKAQLPGRNVRVQGSCQERVGWAARGAGAKALVRCGQVSSGHLYQLGAPGY